MNAKYEFVEGDTKEFNGSTLRRIRALVAIGVSVAPGDLGGYIAAEKNLSLTGNALVYGNARVYGNALVSGNDSYLLIGPAKSSGRFTTAHKDAETGVRVNCGCFTGTVQEFSDAVEKTHAGSQPALEQYRAFAALIKVNFGAEGEQA